MYRVSDVNSGSCGALGEGTDEEAGTPRGIAICGASAGIESVMTR
jgi:hypothetical protein